MFFPSPLKLEVESSLGGPWGKWLESLPGKLQLSELEVAGYGSVSGSGGDFVASPQKMEL